MPIKVGEVEDTSTSVKIGDVEEAPKKDKNSIGNLSRQALASVLDIPGGVVGLGGLIQAGIDQLFNTTRANPAAERFGAPEHVFTTARDKPAAQSLDNTMIHVSQDMRKGVNDIVGVGEPETIPEQIARILPGAVIPAGEVSSGSKAVDALSGIVLPFAQTTAKASLPVKAAQIALQGGVAVGADQAIRAASEPPLVIGEPQDAFTKDPYDAGRYKKDNSLEWLIGLGVLAGGSALAYQAVKRAPLDPGVVGYLAKKDLQPDSALKNTPLPPGSRTIGQQFYEKAIDRRAALPDSLRALGVEADVVDDVEGIATRDPNRQAMGILHDGIMPDTGKSIPSYSREVEAPYQALDPASRETFDLGMVAIRERLNRIFSTFKTRFGDSDAFNAFTTKEIQFHTKKIEKAQSEIDRLSKMIDQTDDPHMLDSIERSVMRQNAKINEAQVRINDWRLAGDTGKVMGASGKEWDLNDFWTNSKTAKEMNEFLTDTIGGYRTKTGLLIGKELAGEGELDAAIHNLKKNPQLLAMAQSYGKITEGLLQHGVDQGVWSKEAARKMKDLMTLDELGPMYVPGRENLPDMTTPQKFMRLFGINTTGAKDLARDIIGNMNIRALDVGQGIQKPMNPTEVLHSYVAAVFNHVQKSKMQAKALDAMSKALNDAQAAGLMEKPGIDVGLLGVSDDVHGGNPINESSSYVRSLRSQGVDLEKNMITVQRDGKLENWYVSDKGLRDALEMAPRAVAGFDAIGTQMKNAFTAGTTRNALFAPAQFLYSMYQIGINSMAHGVGFNPATAIKGFAHAASTNILRETGAILRKNIVENTMMGKQNSAWVEGLANRIEKRVADTFYDRFNRETGGLHSNYYSKDTSALLPDLTKQYGETYRDPGAWKIAWRYLSALNGAMHDGAMLGLQMRLAGQKAKSLQTTVKNLTGADLDAINVQSKKIGGDFRAVGSGETANKIANWVPWSGAMINSLASFGRAAKTNPVGFLGGITSWIVAPTVLEYIMTYGLGSEEQKRAYSQQYSDNMMSSNLVVPTGDPNKPMLLPLPPEAAIFRAATLAAIDGLVGYSNDYRELPTNNPNLGPSLDLNKPLPGHDQVFEEQQKKDYKRMMMIALARFFNVPLPPAMQALAAEAGQMLYLGPPTDAEAPTAGNIRPLGGTEKISGMEQGQSRFPDSPFTREVEGVMNALLGFIGSLTVGMSNAFDQGSRADLATGIGNAISEGAREITGFTRVLNPLTGESSRPTANDATEEKVRIKSNGLDGLIKEFNNRRTMGSVVNPKTMENYPGDAAYPSYSPLMDMISMKAANYQNVNATFEKLVSDAQRIRVDVLGSTFVSKSVTRNDVLNGLLADQVGKPFTPELKRKAEDAITWEIKSYRELMYANLLQVEKDIQDYLDQSGYKGEPFKLEKAGAIAASVRQLAPTLEASPTP